MLTALPAVTFRGQAAELCGSMALAALFAGLASTILAALGGVSELTQVGLGFFITVATCWAILIPAKFWSGQRGDSWGRRFAMMGCGLLVAGLSLWLQGRMPQDVIKEVSPGHHQVQGITSSAFSVVAEGFAYFGLTFFALRWWRMADRRRCHRFSLAPLLAAGFWGFVPLLVWPNELHGALALVIASAIVQIVSPWEQPPPPCARRMRLRYA